MESNLLEIAKRNLSPEKYRELMSCLDAQPPVFTDPSFKYQTEFINHPARLKVLLSPRRSGKSVAIGRLLFKTAYENPGCTMLYIGLTRESAKRIMIRDIIEPLIKETGLKVEENKSELSFLFPNKSILYLLGMDSSDAERKKVYGYKLMLATVDESALYSIDLRDMIYSSLKPACMDLGGTICMVGMPSNKPTGIFYDLTKNAEPSKPSQWDIQDPDPLHAHMWHGFTWSAEHNPYMREQYLKEVKEMTSLNPAIINTPMFKADYLGLWSAQSTTLFGHPRTYVQLPPVYKVAIGCDIGYTAHASSDYSAAVALAEADGNYYILDVIRFKAEPVEAKRLFKQFGAKYPQASWTMLGPPTEAAGALYFSMEGIPMSFVPTMKTKLQKSLDLISKWNEGRVLVPQSAPWLKDLVNEALLFTGEKSDKHDDMIDSAANAMFNLPQSIKVIKPAYNTPEWVQAEVKRMKQQAFMPLEDDPPWDSPSTDW